MDTMNEYLTLNDSQVDAAYPEKMERIALRFLSEGRVSMAETARRRAEHYKANGVILIYDNGELVPVKDVTIYHYGNVTRVTA